MEDFRYLCRSSHVTNEWHEEFQNIAIEKKIGSTKLKSSHAHTHTHTHIHIYICMYVFIYLYMLYIYICYVKCIFTYLYIFVSGPQKPGRVDWGANLKFSKIYYDL